MIREFQYIGRDLFLTGLVSSLIVGDVTFSEVVKALCNVHDTLWTGSKPNGLF